MDLWFRCAYLFVRVFLIFNLYVDCIGIYEKCSFDTITDNVANHADSNSKKFKIIILWES